VARIDLERFVELRERLGELAAGGEQPAELVTGRRVARLKGKGPAKVSGRLRPGAGARGEKTEIVERLRVAPVELQRAPGRRGRLVRLLQRAARDAEMEPRSRDTRIELDRAPVLGRSLGDFPIFVERATQAQHRFAVAGPESEALAIGAVRVVIEARGEQ